MAIEGECLTYIKKISSLMPEQVFRYWDTKGRKEKYIFVFFFEAFKALEVFADAINDTGYSQAAMILRQALEEISLVSFLIKNKDKVLDSFITHFEFKFSLVNLPIDERRNRVKSFSGNRKNPNVFVDYGWMEPITGSSIGPEKLVETAGFPDLVSWRKVFNYFTHGTVVMPQFSCYGWQRVGRDLINIGSALLDSLCCEFHNFTKFDFVFDGEPLFEEFRHAYKKLISMINNENGSPDTKLTN